MEIVSFKPGSCFKDLVDKTFQKQRQRLLTQLPLAEVHHIGSTAIPDSITKGDLDVNVRVTQQEFAKAVELLKAMYEISQPNNWTANFASFKDNRVGMDFGVQLTAIGSPEDRFLVQRDILLSHPELVERLNMLKMTYEGKSMDEYRKAKADFFAKIDADTRLK